MPTTKAKKSEFQKVLAILNEKQVVGIRGYWMSKNSTQYEMYDFEKDSFVVNRSAPSLRFILRPDAINKTQYDPFQVLIREREGQLSFTSPVYEDPTRDYPLRMFSSDNEILFVCSYGNEQTYFHIFLSK